MPALRPDARPEHHLTFTVPQTADELPARLVPMLDIAERFTLSIHTVRMWVSNGKLTRYRVGGAVRVDPDEVASLITVSRKGSSR